MTPAIGHREVEQFRALVADRFGLYFEDAKLGMLADVMRRRVEALDTAGELYLKRLAPSQCPTDELRQLAEALTVTETYFYRNADQIRAFVEAALPQCLAANAGTRRIRVLSAGCASGDEPYSLAIAIREQAPHAADQVSIAAVDMNPAMLEKARRRRYGAWSLRELPEALRSRWFRADGASFVLDESVGRTVTFEERNLVRDAELWRPQSWDVVYCRNVLMYFDAPVAQAVVSRIARSLVPGGYLFLGHAETLRGLSNDFHLCHTHGTFYYRLKEGAVEHDVPAAPRPQTAWGPPPPIDASWVETVQGAADRIGALAAASRGVVMPPGAAAPVGAATPDLYRTLELMRTERFDEALSLLGALPAEQARTPEALLLRAVSLAHRGALAPAETVCRELLEGDKLNAGAHYVLALCREGGGDLAGAMEEDRTAVYLDPGFGMARLHLGILARRRGERELARRELTKALTLLQQEDASRVVLFGGGFGREALVALCRAELGRSGERT